MSKVRKKFLFATHFKHLFKHNWKVERYNYLLINKEYKKIDYGGWLDTSRGVNIYYEFETRQELNEWLRDEVAKNDRENWVVYKRLKSLAPKPSQEKGKEL